MKSKYEVVQDRNFREDYRAEAMDLSSGDCFVVIFSGPDAQQRAGEYAAWKNSQ
jgi:hypothetical protein